MLAYHLKKIFSDFKNYPNMDYGQRHVFWRKLQALLFLALFPVFLGMGILSRTWKFFKGR
jgi:hypothetical protein